MKALSVKKTEAPHAINLLPVLTFSEELTIDTPFGEVVISHTVPGIWITRYSDEVSRCGEKFVTHTMIHETLTGCKEPPLHLEATRHICGNIVYRYVHRDEDGLIDFYRAIVVESASRLN